MFWAWGCFGPREVVLVVVVEMEVGVYGRVVLGFASLSFASINLARLLLG